MAIPCSHSMPSAVTLDSRDAESNSKTRLSLDVEDCAVANPGSAQRRFFIATAEFIS